MTLIQAITYALCSAILSGIFCLWLGLTIGKRVALRRYRAMLERSGSRFGRADL